MDSKTNGGTKEGYTVADFIIISEPVAIELECPHCEEEVRIPWREIEVPECWSDNWPSVSCPNCGKEIALDDWQYD